MAPLSSPGCDTESRPSFAVIYENEELIVINKPYDIAMDGDERPVTVEKWAVSHVAHRNSNLSTKRSDTKKIVKFVHQLDYATSGVLCLALSREMASRLAHCFEMRTTRKAYVAVLRGAIPPLAELCHVRIVNIRDVSIASFIHKCIENAGCHSQNSHIEADDHQLAEVSLPIGHDEGDSEGFRMAVNGRQARSALTYVVVLRRGRVGHEEVTKVLLVPRTGRRHQLRVHCRAIGYPILGDKAYDNSGDAQQWSRMMLHAWSLCLPVSVNPVTSEQERVAQKKKRRRETLGIEGSSKEEIEWTLFTTNDPFQMCKRSNNEQQIQWRDETDAE